METPSNDGTASAAPAEIGCAYRVIRLCVVLLLCAFAFMPSMSRAQTKQPANRASEPVPKPAVPAILAAFDNYEVVGMTEAHGMKDTDDFIFSLIRNPAFPEKVNDIAVECGNSLYQPILDRYIAGEPVAFAEVRKVWRNTTQPMCGLSAFFEQLFPLVRTINQKLPLGKRLRVLAGDSPVDWDQVTTNISDAPKKFFDRNGSIASVMENEVLSKHRKALMLFGIMHLMHGVANDAVARYEKDYPNVTFVISEVTYFNQDLAGLSRSPFVTWSFPSLALAKGTWLGALDITRFFPPPIHIDKDCNASVAEFPKDLQKPMENLIDAFLYVGPQDLALSEQVPADIALDTTYMKEWLRREVLVEFPGAEFATQQELDDDILRGAEDPIFEVPKAPDTKAIAQSCLDLKKKAKQRTQMTNQ